METQHIERPSVSGQTRVLRIPGGKNKKIIKIGTWNVRSLYEVGKLDNTIQEMNRLKIDVLGISETWWTDCGEFKSSNAKIYHSGNRDQIHRKGVAIIVGNNIIPYVAGYVPMSERTMMLKINAKPINLNIIQVYAPTSDSDNEDIEKFYSEIEQLLTMTKPHEITIIQGDFNAKVGNEEIPGVTGKYGLGTRNERGDKLIQFCQEHKMKISNTTFCLHPRRLYTWKSPQDNGRNIVRNQIDYILINNRFCSCITKCSTFPGADVPSDHNLLLCNVRIKLSSTRKNKPKRKANTEKLRDPEIKQMVKTRLNNNLNEIKEDDQSNLWDNIRNAVNGTTKNIPAAEQNRRKEEWVTEHIRELRNERRKHRNKNFEKYWELNQEIRAATRAAKTAHVNRQCQEIEILQDLHDDYNLHKKLKEASGVYRRTTSGTLFDDNNKAAFDISERKKIWQNYVKDLFIDNERSMPSNFTETDLTGRRISIEEVKCAIETLKDKKATGPDEIPSEVLKLIDENNIHILATLFNNIYNTGTYPHDWLLSTFIPIPKKSNARRCNDFRLISLMSHALKIFLRIIHSRIYSKCEEYMGATQFGFKQGMGTREALLSIQVLIQKCRDMQKDVYLCFVDYEKAFDTVRHDKLIEILKSIRIDGKEIRCIQNLYWHQVANIEVDGEITDNIPISKGVRQGCILSPLLFNIYAESIFRESVNNEITGVRISGVLINNIRYADDTTLLSNSMSGLQKLVDKLTQRSEAYGLKINTKKTKYMIVSRKDSHQNNTPLLIHNSEIERVKKFKYLGVILNEEWDTSVEIKCRIEMARNSFFKYKNILTSHDINLSTKIRFIKCYVWSVLLYAVETWTLKSADEKKLEAFEIWLYRRVLKIRWTAHISNEEVLRRMNTDRQLLRAIRTRKIAYLGHIMRNNKYKIPQTIIKGYIDGKRGRGRRETTWIRNIQDWTRFSDERNLLMAAVERQLYYVE